MSDEPKMPENPQDPGGAGGDADEYPLIGKTKASRIERMAIHQRFPISEQEARAVIARQIKDATDPGNTPREANSAARAVFQAMTINQADEHKQQPDEVNINMKGVRILEDDDWYGNRERLNAIAAAASGTDSDGLGPVQGSGSRPQVGKNGDGTTSGD